jgi:sterol 14-demethylase
MRDPAAFQRSGHRRHGDVFSASVLGVPLLFANGDQTLDKMLWAKNEELSSVAAYRQLFGRLLGEELFVDIAPETYKGLSIAGLRKQTAALSRFCAEVLREKVGEHPGVVDALRLTNDLVFDLSCWYVCGAELPAQTRHELADLFEVVESNYSVLGVLFPVETPAFKRRVRARKRIIEIVEGAIARRMKSPPAEPDYMQTLIDGRRAAQPEGSEREILEPAALAVMGVIFGAHTNTAMSLAAALCDLLTHPKHFKLVREEVARVVGSGEIDFETLMRMPTLFRCINESLRLRSNGGLWRKVMKPVEVGGYTLPEGTLVGTSMGLVNHAPDRYPSPGTWDPDRYLGITTDEFQSPAGGSRSFTYGAFGAGRHVCPGRSVAYVILGTALSVILRDYEPRLVRKPWLWFDLLTPGMARPIGPLRIELTGRSYSTARG